MSEAAEEAEVLSIDDLMDSDSGEESTTEEVESAKEPKEEAEPEGKAEPEGTEDKSSTPDETKKDDSWHLKAVMDERDKRQKAQKELEELRKELEGLKTGKTEKTSVFEDEAKFRNELMSEFEQERINDRLNMSQALAEREFGRDKVAEAVASFKELAADNPDLGRRIQSAPLPYHELMEIVAKHNELKQMEDIDSYREKLRAEERAKVLAELELEKAEKAKKRDSVTPSLAAKRSASGGNKQDADLISLDDFVPD